MAVLMLSLGTSGAVWTFAQEGIQDKTASAQTLQTKFSEWINERMALEYEQHEFHRKAHEEKLAQKRGMNIPDWKYTSDELTFDDTFQAPEDPAQWPLWRDWLAQWREDKRKALAYDDSYYSDEAYAWIS